ncbi:two component, sigma54 specific, transcriptional regulator, Fis family protein [Minicystis rosea]|nr:two component, sigma54 specific, transcriptional regulator, Fis family protein [Minicystis rosea]
MRSTELILDPALEARIEKVAKADGDVLITGAPGTGKTRIAARIHAESARAKRPFVAQNCAAIPSELADSMLFGHVKGAFTTAVQDARGIVEKAEGGTLFLDEIGELPLAVQAKLLTLLEERVYRRVGSTEEHKANFRLVAATNRDLREMCNQGLFREDLYHRINVFRITLPSLRESPAEARRIAAAQAEALGLEEPFKGEALAAVERLSRHPLAWPGNAREIWNFLQQSVLGIDEAERSITEDWARRKSADGAGRLTPFGPAVSPSLTERERFAELLRQLTTPGARPKAVASREVSLELASRFLDALPGPVALDDVKTILGRSDKRTVADNVKLLKNSWLVRSVSGGLTAIWPPATSTLLGFDDGEWIPVGPGSMLTAAHGDRIRVEITARCAGTLTVVMVTHRPGHAPSFATITQERELKASEPWPVEIELDEVGGLEQLLVHVGPPAGRGGRAVEPTHTAGLMPDADALEQGRRTVLGKWKGGWLSEHLVFHVRGPR